jgi:adenylate cyclase
MWKQIKLLTWKYRGVVITAPTVSGFIILLRMFGLLQYWEGQAFDKFVRISPPLPQDNNITIIEVTEADLQRYGFPLPDASVAELIEKIKAQHPKAIGVDIYRDLPVGDGGDNLNKVYQTTPNLVGIQKVGIPRVAPSKKLKELGRVVANDLMLDADGKLRRGLLSLPDKDGEEILTLGMNMALQYLEKQGVNIEITSDNQIKIGKNILNKLGNNDGGYINIDNGGYQVLLKSYRSPRSFNFVSLQQVLEGKISKELFKNRLIFIGNTAESLRDFTSTPYGTIKQTSGIDAHAQLTSAIITHVLERPLLIQTWNDQWEYLWIAGWGFLGAVLVWQQRNYKIYSFLDRVKVTLSLFATGSVLVTITYIAFVSNYWIPIIPPLLAFSGSTIIVMAYLSQSVANMRKTLGRYLTDDVVTSLLENPQGLNLIGEKRKVTTLISDIRGFTSMSEKLPPEEVVKVLNLYLNVMNKIIKKYGGTINDIMGDGLVIFFGAPIQKADDTERAVACAIAMQQAMEKVNQKNSELNLPELQMGIGINTGEVVVGNIGSEEHVKYTAIGSHVNLAARIESYTVGGQVLISESTYNELSTILKVRQTVEASMKGVANTVTLYDVEGMIGNFNLFLTEAAENMVSLQEPLELNFTILEGKHLSEETFAGKLMQLSRKSGLVYADKLPAVLSNIKITLPDGEIYGKVTHHLAEKQGFYVQFTNLAPEMEKILKANLGLIP